MKPAQAPIRMVARQKLYGGPGEHVGVLLPSGYIAHRTPMGNELSRFDQFSRGLAVRELRRARPEAREAILERVAATAGKPAPYHLTDNNCEHYASWLMDGQPKSPQISLLVALVLGGIVLSELGA